MVCVLAHWVRQESDIIPGLLSLSPEQLGVMPDADISCFLGAFPSFHRAEIIGYGASSRVYRAFLDKEHTRQVVLKEFRPQPENARYEARILAHLAANRALLVSRLVAQAEAMLVLEPLGVVIGERTIISVEHAHALINTVVGMHRLGVLHRDIRPDNIVLYAQPSFVWIPRSRQDAEADLQSGRGHMLASPDARSDGATVATDESSVSARMSSLPDAPAASPAVTAPNGLYLIDFAFAVQAEAEYGTDAHLVFLVPCYLALRVHLLMCVGARLTVCSGAVSRHHQIRLRFRACSAREYAVRGALDTAGRSTQPAADVLCTSPPRRAAASVCPAE